MALVEDGWLGHVVAKLGRAVHSDGLGLARDAVRALQSQRQTAPGLCGQFDEPNNERPSPLAYLPASCMHASSATRSGAQRARCVDLLRRSSTISISEESSSQRQSTIRWARIGNPLRGTCTILRRAITTWLGSVCRPWSRSSRPTTATTSRSRRTNASCELIAGSLSHTRTPVRAPVRAPVWRLPGACLAPAWRCTPSPRRGKKEKKKKTKRKKRKKRKKTKRNKRKKRKNQRKPPHASRRYKFFQRNKFPIAQILGYWDDPDECVPDHCSLA